MPHLITLGWCLFIIFVEECSGFFHVLLANKKKKVPENFSAHLTRIERRLEYDNSFAYFHLRTEKDDEIDEEKVFMALSGMRIAHINSTRARLIKCSNKTLMK